MRRAEDDGRRTIRAVRLFRSDLQHLIDLAGKGAIEIEHEGMVYDSVEELAQHVQREPIRELRIVVRGEYDAEELSIWFTDDRVRLHGCPRGRHRIFPVLDFLLQHTRLFAIPPTATWNGLVIGGGSMVWMLACVWIVQLLLPSPWRGPIWALMVVLGGGLLVFNPLRIGHSKIYLHNPQERPPFLQRNRDLVIAMAGALFGAVVAVVLQRLLG